ncbi:hypothetical protein MIMGU_mgv1a016578mg [Erythranthe guttata]|uniref:Uncharacterized protein n=1 Tax=Erythranthe guttata TaxID=4155 RepID=A0A022Q426_ERYGU|nr:hypothetical protein MIMGU_mgv1a016578mg [Erythranthe guttata]
MYLKIVELDVSPDLFERLSTGNLRHAAEERLHFRRHRARLHYTSRLPLLRLHSRLRRRCRNPHGAHVSGDELNGEGRRRRLHERRRFSCKETRSHAQRHRHFCFSCSSVRESVLDL